MVRLVGAGDRRFLCVWIPLPAKNGPRLAPGAAQYNRVQAQAFSNHINYIYLPFSLHICQVSQKVSCTTAGKTSSSSCERTSPFEEHVKGISGSGPKETAVNTSVNFQKFRSEQCLKAFVHTTEHLFILLCQRNLLVLP